MGARTISASLCVIRGEARRLGKQRATLSAISCRTSRLFRETVGSKPCVDRDPWSPLCRLQTLAFAAALSSFRRYRGRRAAPRHFASAGSREGVCMAYPTFVPRGDMRSGRLIPVINSSSSSLKSAPFEIGATSEATTRGEIENPGSTAHLKIRVSKGADPGAKCWPPSAPEDFAEVAAVSLAFIDEHWGTDSLIATDCPVVQRGARHIGHERLTAESLASLEALTRLQSLHLSFSLTPIRAVSAVWPTLRGAYVRNVGAGEEATIARHAKAHWSGAAR